MNKYIRFKADHSESIARRKLKKELTHDANRMKELIAFVLYLKPETDFQEKEGITYKELGELMGFSGAYAGRLMGGGQYRATH